MYKCVHIHICVCYICVYMCAHMHVRIGICVCMCAHVYAGACVCTCVSACHMSLHQNLDEVFDRPSCLWGFVLNALGSCTSS